MEGLMPATPWRFERGDLMDILKFRNVAWALLFATVFAGVSLAGHGREVLLLVAFAGAIAAVVSPPHGFAVCVFLFGFRNDAYAVGAINIADPLFALVAASWIVHTLLKCRLQVHHSFIPVMLYFGVSVLSGVMVQVPGNFAGAIIRLSYLILLYVVALQLMHRRETFLLAIKAFLAAGLVMAVCSLIGFAERWVLHHSGIPFVDASGRPGTQSIAVDPVRVGSFMGFPIMLVAGLQQRATTRTGRVLASFLFWLGIIGVTLSLSRSMILQLLPALVIMWLLTRRHLPRLIFMGTVVGAVLAFLVFMPVNSKFARQYKLGRWAIAGRLAEERTEPREIIWTAAIKAFRASPIFGLGMSNFQARYLEFREPWNTQGSLYSGKRPTHSTYLTALSETGIIGTATLIGMICYFFLLGRYVTWQARADGDEARFLIGAAALAAFAGQVVAGIALDLFTHNHVWVIMAVLAVLDRPARASGQQANSGDTRTVA